MTSLRTGDALPLFAISYLAFLLLQYAEHAEHQQSQRYACQNHISFLTFSHSECKGTNKRAKSKRKTCFSFLFRAKVPSTKSEVRLSEKKTKGKTYFSFRKRAIFRNFSYLCTRKASRAVIFGWTRQPSNWSHGGQYDAEVKLIIHFKNIPSYATTHLLHQVCPALRRHADSRVSKHLQFPGAKPRLVLHASLPRPGTPRRVPPPRHRYHLHLRWTNYFFRPSSQVRHDQQSTYSQRLNIPPIQNSALGSLLFANGGVYNILVRDRYQSLFFSSAC